MTSKINGVTPGCGVVCLDCSKDEREGCWSTRVCLLGNDSIGLSADLVKRRKSKGEPHKEYRGFIV